MDGNGQYPVMTIDDLILTIRRRNAALEAEGKRLAQMEADRIYAPYIAAINENLARIAELEMFITESSNGKHGSQSDNATITHE